MPAGLMLVWCVLLSGQAAAADPLPRATIHPLVHSRLLRAGGNPIVVWVYFRDRDFSNDSERAAALAKARQTLHPRTVKRRLRRRRIPGVVDRHDLPLTERYVEQVRSSGAVIRVRSRWLNAVSVLASGTQIAALAESPSVRLIEPVRRGRPLEAVPITHPEPTPARQMQGTGTGSFYGLAEDQLDQIGIIDMHDAGFTGSSVVIGVLDTGFERSHEAYNAPGHPLAVLDEWDFLENDGNTAIEAGDDPDQHVHGTLVLSAIAAYKPNVLVGGAYNASFILVKTEDVTDEYPMEEDFYVAGLEFLEAGGADVATSSLGYIEWYTWFDLDGLTAVTTLAVNIATDNGMACCTAAGNGGIDQDLPSLIAPADAFDVVTCGAVDDAGFTADFSANGPTADGRVKPEVLARGVATMTVDANDPTEYSSANGTSLSTPLIAAGVALLLDAHPTWTVEQVRTALFQTADYYQANGMPDPEFRRGYGIINVFAAAQVSFCEADLSDDGTVDAADLAQLLGAWGSNPGHPADLTGDGSVDAADLALLLGAWGSCS